MNQQQRTCRWCGQAFEVRTVTQKYCCAACRNRYYSHLRREGIQEARESITFRCANPACGRVVVTETAVRDMRTRFCCQRCEKAFWKHPPRDSSVQYVVKTIRGIAAERWEAKE